MGSALAGGTCQYKTPCFFRPMSFRKPFKAVPVKPTERHQREMEERQLAEARRQARTRVILIALGIGFGVFVGLKFLGLIA